MFGKLTNFSYVRSGKEAFGFYLAYLLFIVILSVVVSALFNGIGFISPEFGFRRGMQLGTTVAIISCISISYLIISQKKLTSNFGYILLALLSGLLAVAGGGLLGLIIPAILTTKSTKGKKK